MTKHSLLIFLVVIFPNLSIEWKVRRHLRIWNTNSLTQVWPEPFPGNRSLGYSWLRADVSGQVWIIIKWQRCCSHRLLDLKVILRPSPSPIMNFSSVAGRFACVWQWWGGVGWRFVVWGLEGRAIGLVWRWPHSQQRVLSPREVPTRMCRTKTSGISFPSSLRIHFKNFLPEP